MSPINALTHKSTFLFVSVLFAQPTTQPTMTRTATYVLLTLGFVCSARTEDAPLPEKAQKLRESYRAAVDRATTPLTKTYLAELQRLKNEYTKAADLKGALAIENEIGLLSPSTESDAASPKDKDKLTRRESTKNLVAHQWAFIGGAKTEDTPGPSKPDHRIVIFSENGTAKYANYPGVFTWSIEPNGELLYQPDNPKYKARFRRLSSELWVGKIYGDAADAMGIIHLKAQP